MEIRISISFILMLLQINTGCVGYEPKCNLNKRNAIYESVSFSKEVIKHLDRYARLKSFLRSNADSILSYNKGDCASFLKDDFGELKLSEIPPNLIEDFTSIYKEIDKNFLYSFNVCKDGSIKIFPIYNEGAIEVIHVLLWNEDLDVSHTNDLNDPNYELYKDTTLNKTVRYEISVGCHSR